MGLIEGADNTTTDPTHIQSVNIPTTLSSLTLTPVTHRMLNANPTSNDINMTLPPGSASIDGVPFFVRRIVTTSNEVNLVPDTTDLINGVNATITLPSVNDYIQVQWDNTAGEWVITDSAIAVEAEVRVDTAADLPEAVIGVITLVTNKIYNINTVIDIGSDRIDANGALLIGLSSSISGITSTTTGALISSINTSVYLEKINLIAATGNLFDCSDSGTNLFILTEVTCSSLEGGGTIDGFFYVIAKDCLISNSTTSGFVFQGTIELIFLDSCGLANMAGIALDFSAATAINIVNINNLLMNVPVFQIGISNIVDSTNIGSIFRLQDSNFFGTGTYIDTLTKCDISVFFENNFGNNGTEDSTPNGTIYIADGAEAVTDLSTPPLNTITAIAGTFTLSNTNCKMTNDATGKLTYTGSNAITVHISYKALLDVAAGINKDYVVYIRKNGTDLDLASRDEISLDAANPTKTVGFGEVEMTTDDYIELVMEAITDQTDVTASALTMTARL